jgi:hypothetical protein
MDQSDLSVLIIARDVLESHGMCGLSFGNIKSIPLDSLALKLRCDVLEEGV